MVALTKTDLVDSEWLDMVRHDVERLLAPTTLAGSPIVACSARTGDGLADLMASLDERLENTPVRRDIGRPRLPIDRVFTLAGFGTVVTGTLLDGTLSVGNEVEVVPGGRLARVRGLQNHKQKVSQAAPGRRTAVNLAGVGVSELARGMQLMRPSTIPLSSLADVRLRLLEGARLRHGGRCIVHHFAAEVEARVSLLEADELSGGEGWAQLRLAQPLPLVHGDRVILRAGGETLGGGIVVDIETGRHRRRHAPTIERLGALLDGSSSEVVSLLERRQPAKLVDLTSGGSRAADVEAALTSEIRAGRVVLCPPYYLTAQRYADLKTATERLLRGFHQRFPLRPGKPREELRSQLGLQSEVADSLLEYLSASGAIELRRDVISTAGWEPNLANDQQVPLQGFLTGLRAMPYSPAQKAIDAEVAAYAEGQRLAVRAGDIFFSPEAYDEMVGRIVAEAATHPLTMAEVRDMFGSSRRYVQALLEHLDQIKILRRVGDTHVLRDRIAAEQLAGAAGAKAPDEHRP